MSETIYIKLPRAPRRARVVGFDGPEGGRVISQGRRSLAAEIETAREAALQEGYDRAQGEWTSCFSKMFDRLEEEAARMLRWRQEQKAALERNVVDLALAVAEKFLISERDRRQYAIPVIVRSILENLEEREDRLTVALNPEDLETFTGEGALGEEGSYSTLKLVADPSIPKAGCRVETGSGSVALSLEEQMAAIQKTLLNLEVPDHDG